MRKRLTDLTVKNYTYAGAFLQAYKRKAPEVGRVEVGDELCPGLALRITSAEAKSYVVRGRIKDRAKATTGDMKPTAPIRMTLSGSALAWKIDAARDQAREWIMQMARGEDPRVKLAPPTPAKVRLFSEVLDAFITGKIAKLRSGKTTESEIRRHLAPWAALPIDAIDAEAVVKLIENIVAAGHETTAGRMFAHIKSLFRWSCAPGRGLKIDPTVGLSKRDYVGKPKARDTVLSNDALRSVWIASDKLIAPYGQFIRLLILTGQRLREVSDMAWSEIDFAEKVWNIPASRMKGKKAHEVPLTAQMLVILATVKRSGPYVFSVDGKRPISGFSVLKAKLDKATGPLEVDWTFHDLRRTMRTGLASIEGIAHDVAERVIAHAQSTISQTYNLHDYRVKKRHALEMWDARVMAIVNPPVDNVVAIRA